MGPAPILLAVFAAAGAALLGLTIWRPAIGCAVLALAIPLTTGLGRNTVIPLLRPNEALLLVVAAGLVAHYLHRRRYLPITGLDLLVASFAVGSALIPSLVLFVTHSEADLDRWRTVLGPLQFLMVYLVFSRTELSGRSLGICLNLALFASLIVGLVAIAQLTDILPGFRTVLETYYFPLPLHSWDPVHRPTSLLGHYSAVGAFAVLNYSLALAMAATRHPSFSRIWLSLVMIVNVAALLASLTVAPIFGLLLVTGAILSYARRVPPQLAMAAGGVVIALVLFSPFLSGRLKDQQIGFSPGQGITIPRSLAFRIQLWEEFFIPALAEHVWLGTGTMIPSEVPEALTNNVDNEYLGAAFRAGVLGVVLLIGLLVGLAMTGWRCRESRAPWGRSLGAASFAYAVLIATIGISAEYLTYGGVSQHIAMVVGLLAGFARPQRLPFPLPAAVENEPTAGWRLGVG